MKNKLVAYLEPPNFPNDDVKSTAARALNTLLLSILALMFLWVVIAIPFFVERKTTGVMAALGISLVLLSLRRIMCKGEIQLASSLFLIFWGGCLMLFSLLSGGISSVVMVSSTSLVVMAGVLLGAQATVIAALAIGGTGLGMVLLQQARALPEPYFPAAGLTAWLIYASFLFWTAVPVYIMIRDLRRANQVSKQQLAEIQQIQDTLRESEQRYRTLSEAAFEGVAITQEGEFVDLNDQLAQMLGYTREELIGKRVESVVAVDDQPRVAGMIQTGQVEPYQQLARRKDGSVFPVEVRARLLAAQPTSLRLTTIRDITEQVQAEQTLRGSEQLYRMLFQSNPLPLWVYDLETLAFLAVNDAAIERYGYSRQEFLGMTIKDIRPEEELAALLENVSNVTGGLDRAGIWKHRKKDGTQILVEITSHTLEFNGRPAEMALANDVTEQVLSVAALEKERSFLRQVIDTVPGFFFVKDRESRYVLVNKTLADAYQTTVDDMIGKTEIDFNLDIENAQKLLDIDREILQSRKVKYIPETKAIFMDGEEHWLSTTLVPLLEKSGECNQFLAVTMDITARKQAEASLKKSENEIRKLNVELEQRIFERTEQLAAANHELEAFSYTVSHDLRAPLRAIDGYSRILLEDFGSQLAEEARDLLKIVRHNTHLMGQLIDGLLAFSRLGRQPLNRQHFSPDEIVQQELKKLIQISPEQKIEAEVDDLPICLGDPMLIRQVWVNLLANAVKFSRMREVSLIQIACQVNEDEQVFSVSDNGIGFDMQYANQIFGVFQRLHTVDDYEGTGVGLAVVERIIRRHGGRVWAEAAVDQGATFYFSLPCTAADETAPSQGRPPAGKN